MKYLLTFLITVSLILELKAQKRDEKTFTVVFYNVENLFDTIDAPVFEDEEFTPGSEKNWNEDKYNKKLNDIARVLSSVNKKELPEVIGLAEIENRKVLEDLISTKDLRRGNYQIIHSESPDVRGIDVALLYRKDELEKVKFETIRIDFPFDSSLTTRDILHVKGKLIDGRDMHFFVNHWSSRYGGRKESEPKRMYCAVNLRRQIDLLLSRESDPRFIIMGDFNDEPTNRSLLNILLAGNKQKNIEPGDLYNLYYDMHNIEDKGTYFYKGNWNMLDHIICSYNLIDQPGFYSCGYTDGKIFSEDWMMYENEEGIRLPSRSFGGPNYYGGVSDHLPVYVKLTKDF
ncbi:MAG: endonuclease [Bacteroidota bacterium]